MAHAHRAWYGNSAEDVSVPNTEISIRKFKTIPNSFKMWYGFHGFYLASSHLSWVRIAPGVTNIGFQFPSFRHRVKALPELNSRK